jgi:hypothetical protein
MEEVEADVTQVLVGKLELQIEEQEVVLVHNQMLPVADQVDVL